MYCYMETLCNSDEGWTRLAYLDMSDPSEVCPPELRMIEEAGVRACARQTITEGGSCDSVTFPSYDLSYSQVCGRVTGYQLGNTGGLRSDIEGHSDDIDSFYVHGISITHGSPRQHVWTFIAGNSERDLRNSDCPCNTGNTAVVFPSFVRDDYFCESGWPGSNDWPFLYLDPLWDGERCEELEGACCEGLPWFNKVLPSTTADFLELRICSSRNTNNDSPVGLYEIYVK